MNPNIKIFTDKLTLAYAIRDQFVNLSSSAAILGTRFNVALSGGNTPGLFLESLATNPYVRTIPWECVHVYWGDERCVPPDHPDSNFGMTKRALLDHVEIPKKNIHRIRGETEVKKEVCRYSKEIKTNLPTHENSFPEFDWILLGVGVDGHTASLFPNTQALQERKAICTSSIHPQTGQRRISLTLPTINTAKKVSFCVTGKLKRTVIHEILSRKEGFKRYPAALVKPYNEQLEWYVDEAAAGV